MSGRVVQRTVAFPPPPTLLPLTPTPLPSLRRVLWLSVSTDLRKDAERDLVDVGCHLPLFPKVRWWGGRCRVPRAAAVWQCLLRVACCGYLVANCSFYPLDQKQQQQSPDAQEFSMPT